ncbi:MAG TPA: HlyD family secretion protein [Stellaceae bacterium]|nr:HlyD family secretion protein [Stellaceae bacterium]
MAVTATKPARARAPAPPRGPSIWRRYRRVWIAAGVVAVGLALYFGADRVVAYTADAYIRSDLVAIAPEVSGIVERVAVVDNQKVAAGDPVAAIDPAPFQLAVDLKQQQVAGLEAAVAVKSQVQAGDAANLDAAQAALRLAQQQYDRAQTLTGQQYASQEQLDKAADQLRAAQDRVADQRNQAQIDARQVAEATAQVAVARAELAVAQYNLSRTRLTAPVAGYINNLTLRPGAYAKAGEPLIGIVDSSQWRVIANFKEDIAAAVTPRQRVWVWLDSDPWHFHAGRVQGVGRGIAREQAPDQLLPYVAPTTDWIRLRRRLPVTILLDPPAPSEGLFSGADARVFFWR